MVFDVIHRIVYDFLHIFRKGFRFLHVLILAEFFRYIVHNCSSFINWICCGESFSSCL